MLPLPYVGNTSYCPSILSKYYAIASHTTLVLKRVSQFCTIPSKFFFSLSRFCSASTFKPSLPFLFLAHTSPTMPSGNIIRWVTITFLLKYHGLSEILFDDVSSTGWATKTATYYIKPAPTITQHLRRPHHQVLITVNKRLAIEKESQICRIMGIWHVSTAGKDIEQMKR